MRNLSKLAAVLFVSAMVLTGCSGEPEPVPTSTGPAKIVPPTYNQEAAEKPAFTINGSGQKEIKIDFPAGFDEPSVLTMSATSDVKLAELDYDGEKVEQVASVDESEGGTSVFIKYPTEDSPARTTNFLVEAEDDTSWAISAESLGSIDKVASMSLTGTGPRVFMFDGDADIADIITTGIGTTNVSLVPLKGDSPIKLSGGKNSTVERNEAKSLDSSISNYKGYVFIISADSPDTQSWEILFSKTPEPPKTPEASS